jgi:hypothetical protein
MISRREMVTAGVLGTLAATPGEAVAAESQDEGTARAVSQATAALRDIDTTLENGLVGPNTAYGFLSDIRSRYTTHIRSAGKFPDFLEIGVDVFYQVYDWHVRHNQQIQITRVAEQRFAIQWMFTQLILRWEQDPKYIGVPFDRAV